MNFLAPLLLLGLFLVPVLLALYAWAQRRRTRYAVRFTNLDLLANLAPRRPAWRRHVPPAIYLAAVAALVLGLARPTMVVGHASRGCDRPLDHRRVRLDAGDRRRRRLASTRPQARRRSRSSTSCPRASASGSWPSPRGRSRSSSPTADRGALKTALDGLTARDGTAMGDALMQVLDLAEKIQAERVVRPSARRRPSLRGPRPRHHRRPIRARARPPARLRRASRSSRRSSCPMAPIRSGEHNRSRRRSAPRPWGCRSTRSPSGRRPGR